ncbi:MAG: DEAD/DEAH box helicase family protein, partial [Lachnospiraceae bacterium]|nr:DEAD/DEAH box helicase family protein [Lachnospiraceae bacterium]
MKRKISEIVTGQCINPQNPPYRWEAELPGEETSEESNPFGDRLTRVTIEQPSHSDENMVNQPEKTSENKRYVADKIGKEYQEWPNGYAYFIKAPTGSGKSRFVTHNLLKYIIKQNIEKEHKRVLYLVNRVVLKKQLEKDLKEVENKIFEDFDDKGDVIEDYITITTYQNIERGLKKNFENIIHFLEKFSWVVYDECHYFYTDSTFNTNTELSYDCLRRLFAGKIEVFMSATVDRVRELIINRPANFLRGMEEVQNMKARYMPHDKKIYEMNIDYRNLNIEPLADLEMLVACIKETVGDRGNKWLIFVDSLEMGRDLKRLLTEEDVSEGKDEKQKRGVLPEKEVVFINADFAQDAQAEASVDDIVTESYAKEKVVISTSVMDNGVSFHDSELRNMAIFADTKEMFIQMLGRKRWDKEHGELMNLYIFRRNREHFRKRRERVQEILDVYKEFHEYLKNELTCYVIDGTTNEKLLYGSKQKINAFMELWFNFQEPKRLWGLDIQKISQNLPTSDVNVKDELEWWQERPYNVKNVSSLDKGKQKTNNIIGCQPYTKHRFQQNRSGVFVCVLDIVTRSAPAR